MATYLHRPYVLCGMRSIPVIFCSLALIDIRQNSKIHEAVVAELMSAAGEYWLDDGP